MRKFRFTININGEETGEGIIEIDKKVFAIANSNDFRANLHSFENDEDIAAWIAYRMVERNERVDEIEGLYRAVDKYAAKITQYPAGYNDFEFTAEELSDGIE